MTNQWKDKTALFQSYTKYVMLKHYIFVTLKMAKLSIHHLRVLKVFYRVILLMFLKAFYLSAKLKLFLTSNFYTVSFVTSTCLLLVNILIFASGCHTFHSKLFTLNLPHGYLPTFPSHFFPSSGQIHNQSIGSINSLDAYLSQNVVQKPLFHPLPPVVHIIYCDHGPFTFASYLSVVSAFKMFKPSALYLHVNHDPEVDPDGYFQFLPDLIRDIPVISKVQLKFPLSCSGSIDEQKIAYFRIIGLIGGIAINSRTLLSPSESTRSLFDQKLVIAALDDRDVLLIASAHPDVLAEMPSQRELNSFMVSKKSQEVKCRTINYFSMKEGHPCVYVLEDIFPVQIFTGDNDFAALARWSGYGTSKKLVSHPADKEIVPNIVHYVWLGRRDLDFFAYLSLISSLYVLEAEAVYIHGEEPLGKWWSRIKKDVRVNVINRDFPNSVYGSPIKRFVSHASDYLRADVLLRYGGVYADWDVIFLKKLPSSVRRHNATACVDWPSTGSFPDVLNLGVLVAAPGAQYLRFFLESYRWYLDNDWSYNAIHMPYKIYEKSPQSLNIDRHVQVLCALERCHSAWIPDFKEDKTDHLHDGRFHWQTDAVAIHWTHPDPPAFKDPETLIASTASEADIGKFVLRKAKIIP